MGVGSLTSQLRNQARSLHDGCALRKGLALHGSTGRGGGWQRVWRGLPAFQGPEGGKAYDLLRLRAMNAQPERSGSCDAAPRVFRVL